MQIHFWGEACLSILGEKSGVQIHFWGEARKITGHFLLSTMSILLCQSSKSLGGGGISVIFGGSFPPPPPPVDRTLLYMHMGSHWHIAY